MLDRNTLCICLTIFATVSSVAWAIASVSIWAPTRPQMSAKEVCATYQDARNSIVCYEIAKQ
jgi:hypothetical protein